MRHTNNNAKSEQTASGSGPSCACGAWWRLPLLLAVVLVAVALLNGRGIRQSDGPAGEAPAPPSENGGAVRSAGSPGTAPTGQSVSLGVDFGDGRRREWNTVPWRDGMTVGDLMAQARRDVPAVDGFDFAQQGTGASAFLTRMDGVANEGAGGRNWTYHVNGKRADRSFAVCTLRPGDAVLWKFEAPQ